jgi:ribosomal protein S18
VSPPKADYFESLLHQHDNYMPLRTDEREELLRDNEISFVDGYSSQHGPLKYMSEAAKEKVNEEIDRRMQEISDTGLTKEELLHEKVGDGVKLADDPFFQYMRENRTAREMLLKPGDAYTADRVIELALRQDVGPDPSLMMNRQNYQHRNEEGTAPTWEYKKKYRDTTPVISPEAYFAGHNTTERRRRLFEYDQERPATFINRPLSRNQLRKKMMRPLRKKDIDHYNTPLIAKFLNDVGRLYNRYQTRLPTNVQRKVAKTVKRMRAQFIIPPVGMMKPTDKIPLGSYIEEVEEMQRKTIDPVTGRLFIKHSLQDDLNAKLERERQRMEERFGHLETEQQMEPLEAEAQEQMRVLREMTIEQHRIMPNDRMRHWMLA